ncbi:hypothetical protein [Rhizobium rhizogenes]|uniref:hypothetical protein n=1 Tax=Rhizobium rhizogenes TaxID=359 RepID=UPI001573A699|nr:hypothetical protein [Rhizobium rhizogenes]NTG07119.1 hypothetical protein [Rhizobium rhizogenes]
MTWFLIGLQWAGIAFGIFVLCAIAGLIACWGFTLIYGQSVADDSVGAFEGDSRSFRVRSVDDDNLRSDV